MGNTHCVADGGCPQRADITIANNTEFNLYLDPSKACGRECHHRGMMYLSLESQTRLIDPFFSPLQDGKSPTGKSYKDSNHLT